MIDDQNKYEWVNGEWSSVPTHPGCPGQNPESRKTVVCVCQWLYAEILSLCKCLVTSASNGIRISVL